MELKLDRNKTYGLALEGGGAKGAYQIGAWKALREAGIRFSAVSGTSVGALNGAMIVMDDLEKAENVWNNIHFSQVMDVDDEEMRRLMNRDIPLSELKSTLRSVADIVRNRGFDVTPLRNWVAEVVDADKICHSDMDFFIVTYSLSDHQELELKASDLDKDELCDMLLASAYLPAFRLEKLGGKYYADGGVQDVVPIHALVENGCKDIIALRIFGFGIEKRFRIPDDVHVTTIGPTVDLGNILNFDAEQSRQNMRLGYFDAQRVLYGLYGSTYYIDRTMSEGAARQLGKPRGRYVTLDLSPLQKNADDVLERASRAVGAELRALLGENVKSVLVAGLGNANMTPDAIGPRSAEHVLVTRHLRQNGAFSAFCSVSVLTPGVLGRTGIEAMETLRGTVRAVQPDAVIAIDALASRSLMRLCSTVQLSDTGIVPGSGVGNHRCPLSRDTLGVPVYAIGVPTVVDAATLTLDVLEEAGKSDVDPAALRGHETVMVTTRDIDAQIRELSRVIGYGIDLALQPLDFSELCALMG